MHSVVLREVFLRYFYLNCTVYTGMAIPCTKLFTSMTHLIVKQIFQRFNHNVHREMTVHQHEVSAYTCQIKLKSAIFFFLIIYHW